jgi:TRAP-type C4-dicarboxylate transport system substrate-binding protein
MAVAVVGGLALALAACGGSGSDKAGGAETSEQVVLTLANMDPDPTNIDSPDFVAAVERLSGGSIRIEEKNGWRSDAPIEEGEQRTIEDVRSGKADLTIVPARVWDTIGVKSFRALVAPFLVDSVDLERRVIESPLAARMLEGVEPLGLVGIAVLPGALRYPLGVSRPLVGPADYQGATIGIRPAGVAELTFRALGAEAEVFVPGSLSALDGAELDPVTIATNSYEEQSAALTANVVLWPRAMTIVMNRAAFEALSEEQQHALVLAGRDAVGPLIDRFSDHDGWLERERVCGGDFSLVTATAADLEDLRAAVQPVYEELERDPVTRELVAAIRQMRGEAQLATAETLRCPPDSVTPQAAGELAPELEGQWKATLTREELIQEGELTPAAAAQLAGDRVLQFEDGRFSTKTSADAPQATGTYTVNGNVLTIVWEQGPGIEPGWTTVVGWSVYRDALTFSVVPDGEPMLALTIKPFVRAG